MKVLHLILHHQLYPPKNGGMLRCWNIAQQLAEYLEVDVITLQKNIEDELKRDKIIFSNSTKFLVPALFQNKIKSARKASFLKKLFAALNYRLFFKILSPADRYIVDIIPVLKSVKSNSYDFVVFEHLEALKTSKLLRAYFPNAIFVLDAHNIDHILLSTTTDRKGINKIKKEESRLYEKCDLVLACSRKDQEVFKMLNKERVPVAIIPNGVDIQRNSYELPDFNSVEPHLIFCGSLDYAPNNNGLIWFINNVWFELFKEGAALKLMVVGKGRPGRELLLLLEAPGIEFIGEVEHVIPYYRRAQFAIVPLLQGSGTRLKVLEAMSLGVPVISTAIGAEGIKCSHAQNILICNTASEFIIAIKNLKRHKKESVRLSLSARELVEQEYTWKTIGNTLYENLQLIKKH